MKLISNYEKFYIQYEVLKDKSRLFAFILFDDRPTHKQVGDYVFRSFDWINSLVESADMFGFAFVRDVSFFSDRSINPSLRVAAHFGITPDRLPGIILFTMLPKRKSIQKGVYLPIKANLFSQEPQIIEDVFAGLFGVCQEVLVKTHDDKHLMTELQKGVSAIKRKQKIQPIYKYLGARLEALTKLPDKVVEAVADSFGENLAKRIIP